MPTSKAVAAKEDWSGKKFANNWVIDKKLSCAEYREIYTQLTGETTINKNTHYLCHNENCGIETYIERTVIKRAIDNQTTCLSKCKGCVNGNKAKNCHYSTMARVKPLTKIPDRTAKIEVGKTYGNFIVESISNSSNYSDHQSRAVVKCILCGQTQERRFDSILECSIACDCFRTHSSGEMIIKSYLEKNNISYKAEYSFEDLYSPENGKMRYDFAIFKNNKLIALIEFDGEQHFESVEHWGGKEALERTQTHDHLKNEYAKTNSIPLLRIKYTDILNIDKILKEFLYEKIHF